MGCETAKQPTRLSISSIVHADMEGQSMLIPITIDVKDQAGHDTNALVDSGASGMFINQRLVDKLGLKTFALPQALPVYNVDGTKNKLGEITEATTIDLRIGDRMNKTVLYVTGLGKHDIILGLTWLKTFNPIINWTEGTLELQHKRNTRPTETINRYHIRSIHTDFLSPEAPLEKENDDEVVMAYSPETNEIMVLDIGERTTEEALTELWIRTKVTSATSMAQSEAKEEHTVPPEFADYADIFEKKKSERFPPSRPWDHAINLKPDFVPKDHGVYPVSAPEEKVLKDFIEENLRKGYIRPSKSNMTSSFFFVGKKDGTLRPCQDYRYLNEGTIEDRYPVPNTADVIDKLTGSRIFTKLDLRAGYNNVRIKEGDQWKAAFKTKYGVFEPTVMFFGLCNSPATFQAMMDEIFKEEVDEGWLGIYMDDMIIHSEDEETHRVRTRRVLQKLRDHDLYLNLGKCYFDKDHVEYLGLIVSHNTVAMDPVKIEGILKWTVPETVRQVRAFTGFANFYRRFIPNFSHIARPLNELTKKNQTFKWTEECQQAFDILKGKFAEKPVLAMVEKNKPFELECDASLYATGAVLRQQDSDGHWHPVAYISRSLTETERNYDIYN